MKKLMILAIALGGIINSECYALCICPNSLSATWSITWENGEPLGDINDYFDKTYNSDGKFYVCEHKRQAESGVYINRVVQKGEWEMVNDSTVIEKCEWGNKGDVKINVKRTDDNTIIQTFAFDSNPEKVYVQKLEMIASPIHVRQRTNKSDEGYIEGIGTWAPVNSLVYIIDGKRYSNYEDVKTALPEDKTQIENISVLKDGSALERLTDEEKAAGKSGIMIFNLKK